MIKTWSRTTSTCTNGRKNFDGGVSNYGGMFEEDIIVVKICVKHGAKHRKKPIAALL